VWRAHALQFVDPDRSAPPLRRLEATADGSWSRATRSGVDLVEFALVDGYRMMEVTFADRSRLGEVVVVFGRLA
jgi:hypothetical protein